MRTSISAVCALAVCLGGCSRTPPMSAGNGGEPEAIPTVGVTSVKRKPMMRQLTVSAELVPYQETDVFAKESGYVKDLLVDYGSRVKKGELMAVLDIPELQIQLKQDNGALKMVTAGANLADVVKALNTLGATPADLMSILQAMKAAGALRADLEII